MLSGILFFVKPLDGPHGRWLGYIYCPALERPFFVNEQRMLKGAARPELGAQVEFKEGLTQEGKEFAAATSVREVSATYDSAEPSVALDVTAAVYRLPVQLIRSRLTDKLSTLHEDSGKTLLSISQIKMLADWSAPSISVKQTNIEAPDPPDSQLRFGQLVRDEFDRGFGFVKEQGKGKPEVFAHVKNLKFEPEINEWLVFAVGGDGRLSWARKPVKVLPWLRRSYATFSVDALDKLFQLGDQELAEGVLNFRIERILAAKAEAHVPNGEGLLQKVQGFLPQNLSYAYERLIVSLEDIGKLRLWAQFGNTEDASHFAVALDKVYQSTINQQAEEMPRAPMLGLLDIGREQAKAEAIVKAWWPTQKIESMTEAEQVASSSSLFKWMREWYRLILLGNFLPTPLENYAQRWRILTKEIREQLGRVGGAMLGAAVYEATGTLLPIPELVRERVGLITEDVLLDLVRNGGEAGYIALAEAMRRLGRIEIEDQYKSVRQWLKEFEPFQTEYIDQIRAVLMASVTESSAPIYCLNLWSAGYLLDLDWEKVVGRLDEYSARSASLEVTNTVDLRLAAARRLLQLYSKSAAASEDSIVHFLKALRGGRTSVEGLGSVRGQRQHRAATSQHQRVEGLGLVRGRIVLNERGHVIGAVAKPSQEAIDFQQSVDELVKEVVEERPELAFSLWEKGLLTVMPVSAALARLVEMASVDAWAKLPNWTNENGPYTLKVLLKLLLGVDGVQLMELPRSMLLPWIEEILDNKEKLDADACKALLADLMATKRRDITLPLVVWGLHQINSPADYLRELSVSEELSSVELEALLDAPVAQVRLASATTLLDFAGERLPPVGADQYCLRLLARLGLGKLKVAAVAKLPDFYHQSPTLGRIQRREDSWYLGSYTDLLQAPAAKGSELWDDVDVAFWGDVFGSSSINKVRSKTSEKEILEISQAAELIQRVLEVGSTWLQHQLWKAEVVETPAYDQVYDEINFYADGFDRSGDKTAWEAAHELIKKLNEFQRLAFLDWILEADCISVAATWSSELLHEWLKNLPDTAEKQATWGRLLNTLTTPALLNLWLANLIEHYDFEAYRLLVFTLSPNNQILFLRKTFKLLAAGELQLTANQLNSIVRYSRDELGREAALDYSVDLALVVLGSLARDGALPGEGSIIEVVCRYIKEDTTSLTPVGKELFASCQGRSELKKIRTPDKDTLKGRVDGVEYPASADRKEIFVNGTAFNVMNGTVELFGNTWRVSWIVTPGFDYQPGSNNLKLKPDGIDLCEGRLAYKVDAESQLPFWWCCNRPCYKPNQDGRPAEDWQRFTLADFISILNLPFNADEYYSFVGLINRVNRLLKRLQCRCCNHILRPTGQSDFNFHRVNRFRCTNWNCEEQEREVYLSHCLNGYCMTVIDSRDSNRCSYRTEGRPDKQGMYICAQCGGCCSKQALRRRKENLEKTYRPEMLVSHSQYKLINESLANRLYHWERMRVFCYQCTKPMQQRHSQANYTCPDCRVEYNRDVVHIEVARRKNLFEPEL